MKIYESVKIADYGMHGLWCARLPFGYSYSGSIPDWLLIGVTMYFDTFELAMEFFHTRKSIYDPSIEPAPAM